MMLRERQEIWQLQLLGGAALHSKQTSKDRLDRKQAGLLAFLALEGAQSRSRIAGLLWAESIESTARNNLVQALKRLKTLTDETIVTGDAILSLVNTDTDVLTLETIMFNGDYETVANTTGRFLEGYEFDDCPDFEEWVAIQRERFWQLSIKACVLETARLEQTRDFTGALTWALEHLKRDSISETAYQTLMRLQYTQGDRIAALRTYAQCEETLRQELNASPSLETKKLLEQIKTNTISNTAPRAELPLVVLRPTQLIAREKIWQQMEDAWQTGKAIFLAGAAGLGKSRVVQDFLNTKGHSSLFSGRPGDSNTLYATHTRVYRQLLQDYDMAALPEWVKLELSRILPELRPKNKTIAPISNAQEQLRFFEAKTEATRLANQAGMQHIAIDDLQFMDNASFEAVIHVLQPYWGDTKLRTIFAYRNGELNENAKTILEQAVTAGLAVNIELEAFTENQTRALLDSLALPNTIEASTLHQYSEGNPLYLLEAVRHHLESGESIREAPRLKQLTAQRLENLNQPALRLAQIAAVMNQDFTLERAAPILNKSALELTNELETLEQAQMMSNERFTHDLIFEAVNLSIATGVRRYLHRQIAEILANANLGDSGAARVATHYLAGGEELKATPFLEISAEFAKQQYRLVEFGEIYLKIGSIYLDLPDYEKACEAFVKGYSSLRHLGMSDLLVELTELLKKYAKTPLNRAYALNADATILGLNGKTVEAIESSQEALKYAYLTTDLSLQTACEINLALSFFQNNQLQEAIEHFQLGIQITRDLLQKATATEKVTLEIDLADGLTNLAAVYTRLATHKESEKLFQESILVYKKHNSTIKLIYCLHNYALNYIVQGYCKKAIKLQLEAIKLINEQTHEIVMASYLFAMTAHSCNFLGQYAKALDFAKQGVRIASQNYPVVVPMLQARVAQCQRYLGLFIEAQKTLEEAQKDDIKAFEMKLIVLFEQVRLEHWQGIMKPTKIDELAQLEIHRFPLLLNLQAKLMFTQVFPATQALAFALEVLAGGLHLEPIRIAAQTRVATTLLKLERPIEALEYSQAAIQIPDGVSPEIPLSEIYLTHYQAQAANNDPTAPKTLQRALDLIQEQRAALPLEYHEPFFTNNPINKAILEAARAFGMV